MTTTIDLLAARHCTRRRPALNLAGFCAEEYGVSRRELKHVANGQRGASSRLLTAIQAAHVRFLPNEPATVALPDGSVAHFGPAGLAITFNQPANPNQ